MGWYQCTSCGSKWRTDEDEKHTGKDCPGRSKEFLLKEELAKLKESFSKNIHTLYDLLVESDAPTKQYDYESRKKSAIERAKKALKEFA